MYEPVCYEMLVAKQNYAAKGRSRRPDLIAWPPKEYASALPLSYTALCSVPVVRDVPAEGVLLDDVGQPGLVREEEGQVGGQDTMLHVA